MSNTSNTTATGTGYAQEAGAHPVNTGSVERYPVRRISTETKASTKTSELFIYLAAVAGVLIASAVVDAQDFGPQEAWFYVTLLTVGYLVSRGLAKSGSRDFYDDDNR